MALANEKGKKEEFEAPSVAPISGDNFGGLQVSVGSGGASTDSGSISRPVPSTGKSSDGSLIPGARFDIGMPSVGGDTSGVESSDDSSNSLFGGRDRSYGNDGSSSSNGSSKSSVDTSTPVAQEESYMSSLTDDLYISGEDNKTFSESKQAKADKEAAEQERIDKLLNPEDKEYEITGYDEYWQDEQSHYSERDKDNNRVYNSFDDWEEDILPALQRDIEWVNDKYVSSSYTEPEEREGIINELGNLSHDMQYVLDNWDFGVDFDQKMLAMGEESYGDDARALGYDSFTAMLEGTGESITKFFSFGEGVSYEDYRTEYAEGIREQLAAELSDINNFRDLAIEYDKYCRGYDRIDIDAVSSHYSGDIEKAQAGVAKAQADADAAQKAFEAAEKKFNDNGGWYETTQQRDAAYKELVGEAKEAKDQADAALARAKDQAKAAEDERDKAVEQAEQQNLSRDRMRRYIGNNTVEEWEDSHNVIADILAGKGTAEQNAEWGWSAGVAKVAEAQEALDKAQAAWDAAKGMNVSADYSEDDVRKAREAAMAEVEKAEANLKQAEAETGVSAEEATKAKEKLDAELDYVDSETFKLEYEGMTTEELERVVTDYGMLLDGDAAVYGEGNIKQNELLMAIGYDDEGETTAFDSTIYHDLDTDKYYLVPRYVQDADGNWNYTSRGEAVSAFKSNGLYFGQYDSQDEALKAQAGLTEGALNDFRRYAYWSSTVEELKAERGNILGQLLDVIEDTNIETPEDIDPAKRAELKQQLAELDEALKHAKAMKAEAAKTYNPEDKYEPTREDKIRAAVAKDELQKRKTVEYYESTIKPILESDNTGRAIETAIDNAKAELGPTWKEYQDAIDDWKHKLEEEHGGRISDATAKIDFDKNNPDYAKGLYLEYEQAARAYMDEAKASGTKLNDSELRAEFNKEHPEYLQAVKDKEQELQYLKDLRGVAVEVGKDENGNAIYKADIERDEEYDNKVKDGLSFVDATADIGKLGYDSLNDELEAHGFTEEQIAQFDEYLKKFDLRDALPNDTWTLQEIKTFAYYIGDGDVGRALEFAHDQNKKYADLSKAERAQKIVEFNEAMAQKGRDGNWLAKGYVLAFPFVSGAWTAVGGSLAESIAYYRDAMLAGEAPIRDYNTLTEVFNYATQGIQQVLSQYETGLQIGDFSLNLGHLYSAYASTIQSFETQFVGGLVGKGVASLAPEVVAALGGADEVVGTITSMYINLAFGGSAMADGAMKAYERTGNMETALWNGFANAVNEGLFESLSLDILFNKLPDATSAVGLLLNGIGQGMVEGSEEFFTDIANNAADWFFNQDMSEWQTKYNALVDQGYTPQEAEVRVKKEMRDSLNESFIVGTLSGGPSAIIKSGVDYAKTVSYGTKIIRNDMMDAVIALGDKVTADPVFNAPASTVRAEAPSNINTEINAEAVGRAAPAEATPVAETSPEKSPAQQAVEAILGGTSSSGKEVSNKNAHEIVDNDDLRAAFTAITGKELKGSFSDMKAAIRSAAAEFKQNQTTSTQQNAAQQTAAKATATEEKKPTPIPAKGQTSAGKTEAKGPYAMPETASKKKTGEATPAETIGSRAIKAFGQIKEAYNSRTQAAAEASVKIQAEIDALAPKIKDGTATKDQVKRVAYLEGQQQKTTANMTDLAGKIGYFLQQVYQADPDTFNSWAIKNAEKFSKVSPQSLAQALGAKQHEIQQDADQMAYYYAKQANPGSLVLSNVGSDLQSQYGLSAEVAGNVQDIVGKILRGSTDTSLEEIIKFANGEEMSDKKTEEAVVAYIRNVAKEKNVNLSRLLAVGSTEDILTRAWAFGREFNFNNARGGIRSAEFGSNNYYGTDTHPFAKTEHSVFAEDGRSLNPEAIKALEEEHGKPPSERKIPIPVNTEGKTEAKGKTETKKATIPAKGAAKAAAETKVETQKSAPVKVDVEAYRATLPDSVREQVGQTVHIGKTAYNIFSYINNRRAQNSNLTYDMIAEEFSAIRQGVSAEKAQAKVAEKYGITTPQETPKTTDNGKPKAPSATPVRSNEDAYRQSSQAPWITRGQYVADAMAKGATREAANAAFDRVLSGIEHDIFGVGAEVRRAAPQTTVHTTAQGTVVFDQNVKGLQTEIASLTEQLETLYSEEEMSKARGELFQKQHQTAIQNLEARRARAQADLNKLIERAKVRHNGRVQTHDSGTSGRNGSTDGGRNAGGIPVRESGSDGRQAGTSGSAGSNSEKSSGISGQSVRQQEEVILKDGDRTVSSMVNGTVLYDSKDPNANADNLTSEEKDVLNLANEAGVDRLIFVDADQLFGSGNPARAYYVTVGGEKTIVVNANRGAVNGYHETMHYCLDSYSREEKNALLIEMLSYVFDSKEEADKFFGIYNNETHQKVYAPLYEAFLKGNADPYTLALYEEILCDLWKGLNRYNTPAAQFSSLQQRAYDYVVGKKIIEHATDLAKGNKGAEKSETEEAPVESTPAEEATPVEETAPVEQPVPTLDLSIGRQRLEQLHQTIHNLSDADLEKQMQEMADILNQLSNDNPDRIILEPVANALVDEYMKRLADSRRESDIINSTVQTTVSDQPATDLPKPNRKPRNKKNQPSTPEAEQTTETTEEQPTAPEAEPESTENPVQDELNKLLKDIAAYDAMIADNIADRNKQMKEAPNKDMKDIIKGEANQLIQLLKNERAELQKQADKLKKQLRKENAKGNKDQRKADLEGHEETGSKKKQKDRPEDHIDNRDLGTVGNTGLNAFQYDHPEVKPYFKRAAEVLMRDLIYMQSSMRSQYNEGTIFGATNNFLEKVRKYFKTSEHAIEACESVIKDSGRENYADPKRVELFLDEMLSDGYKPISPETEEIHSSAEYLKLKGTLTGGTPYDARQKAIQGYLEADFEGTLTQEEAERLVDMNFERTGYYDPNTRDGLAEAPATETTESKDTIGNTEVTGLRTAAEIDAEMDDVSKDIERMIGRLEDVEGQVSPETIQAMQAELKEMEDYYDGLVAELNDAYANGRLSAEDSYSGETPDIYGKFSVESYTNGTGFETMYQIVGTDVTTTLNDWIQDVQRMNPDTKAEQTEYVPTGDPVADLLAEARKESPEAKIDELKLIFSDMVTQGKLKVIGPGERDANGVVHLVDIDNITADRMKESPLGHMITYAQEYGRISETEADRQYKLLANLTKMLYDYDDTDLVWAIVGSEMFSAIKNNSDPQYGKTIDFSTICKKTQATIDAISQTMKLLGTGLSKEEIKFVYKMVGEAGESTPCPVCYVFSRWMGLGSVLDNIKRYQEKYGSKNPHGQEEALKLVQEVQNAAVEKMKSKGGKKLTFGKAVNAAQADVKSKLEAAEKAFQDFEEASKKPNVKKNHDILFDRDGNPLSLDYWAEQIKALADEYDKFDAYKWAIKTRLVNADLLVKSSEDVATRLRNKYKIKGETVEAVLENAANSANNTEEFSELVNELSDTVDVLKMIDPERLSKIRQKYHLGKSQSGLKSAITKDKAFGKNFLKDLGKYAKESNISLLDALKEYEGTNSVGNYYRNLLEYERLANDLGTDSFVFNKKYEDVPDDILFDLNKGEQFAKYYPETWTYRTTRGSGLGKAIMPYSDARVGEIVQGVALGDVKDIKIGEARNAFLDLINPANKEAADKIIARARTKMAAQNLIGGMRFQSTSDFRYEYASDYLMAFFEMQAMGANVQLYTKVLEAVDFFANVGCDVNLSVMPRDKGIGELTEKPRDWETNYDRYFTLEDGKYVKLKKGNAAPEFEAGKYHAIVYSDVTGVNGGAAREYVQKYDNVQMIMVGISADHINACLDSDDITFVIPFHGSGNSTRDIQQLMNLLGETIDAKNITDFTDYQTDAQKESKNDARTLRHRIVSGKLLVNGNITLTTEEANILETNAFLKDLFRRFYLDATDKNGRVDKAAAEKNRENITILNVHEDGTTSVNTDFKIDFGKVNDKAFSNKYYLDGKNECYGNFLSGDAAKQIFPYEYWDKSLKQSEAKGNGDAFQEYCKTLGLIPRFSGWTKDKNYKAELDFTKNDNYWKLLIDRKMYDNQGNYRAQQQINLSNVDAYRSTNEATGKERVSVVDTLNPAYGQVTFGAGSEFANRVNPKAPGKDNSVISKINDPRKRDAIAELCVKAILEARDKSDKSYGHMFSNDADIRQAMENHDYIQAARMIAQNPEIKFNEITGELEVNGRASVDEQAVEAFGDWLNWDTSANGFVSHKDYESAFGTYPELDFFKKMVDAQWDSKPTKPVEKEFQNFVSELDDFSKEKLYRTFANYVEGSTVEWDKYYHTSDKVLKGFEKKLKSILEKEIDKKGYTIRTKEELAKFVPEYANAIQQMQDRDENGKFIDNASWHKSHQALYELFTKYPELDYMKRLSNALTPTEKEAIRAEFSNLLSGITDRDALWQLGAYSIYPSQGYYNGGSRVAGEFEKLNAVKRLFSNTIEKRRDQIMEEAGVSSNVKLEARDYTLQEVIDMFNQLNRDEQLNPLAEKVFRITGDLGLTIRGARGTSFRTSHVAGHQLGSVVEYNINRFNDLQITDQEKAGILLHELIHACTQYALKCYDGAYTNPHITNEMMQAVKQIKDVYAAVQADPSFIDKNGERMYGTKSASEMLSELSNPEFREALENKNLFQRIVDAIKKFFGIDTKNALDAASVGLDYLLDNFNYEAYLRWAERANKSIDPNPEVTLKAINAVEDREAKNHPGEVKLYENGPWVKQEYARQDSDGDWVLKDGYKFNAFGELMEFDPTTGKFVPLGTRENNNTDTETDGFMSGVIDDNSNYTIDGFFNSLGEEVTVGKFSVDDILSVTYFAGAGTFDYALRDRLFPIYAVEYDPAIRDMFVKNNGNSVLVTDADVNEVNPRTVLAGHVPYFHASPVCTNFSKANNKSGETERDRKFARSIQKGLRAWLPDVFTLENVKGYLGSDSLKIVTDTLDELGYKWDVDVYRASDYGGATIRDRLFVRAVKNGELPSKPVKTGPTSWWSAVEDIIDTLPVMDEGGLTEARRTRLRNMGIDINNLKQPILLLSGTKGREIQYAYADQPSPTLMTDGSEARIILTDGTILKVTPRVYARIQGLDDEFQFPTQKRNPDKIHQSDAFKIIGNGIPTQLTQAVVNPLLDIIDKQNGKYSADDEQMASTLQMYEDLVDPSEWKASEHQNMNEQMYNRISDGISLWDKVVSFYDTVDEDNYNWLSYDDITQAMRINPFNGNIDGEDMPLASEVMWSLLHLARDQKGENKERIYSLMEEIAPHLVRTEQDKWIRPVGSRFPPIDLDFSNWYNERNPMPEVGYTPKSLEQLHQEAIEAANEADFQRRAYRRSLATEDEYNRAVEKARRAWNMYNTRFNAEQGNGKYSVDIDEGSTFDTFGNAIQLDDYNPEVTQSDLSEDVYYSADGNTAYYQTENGETVVFTNVGENSPEARYINYLEAMNNANANDTTTEPHPIPSATRNEYDGYNNGQSNDGLRRGTEEVLTENQERAFRSAGSNAERNGESRSQSEEPQSVGRFSPEIAPDDPNQFNWFINENGKVITAAEMYPHGSFERSFIDAFTKGDLSKMQDVINELLDGKFKIDDSVFDIIQTILNYDPLFTESERKARVKKVNELRQKYGTQKAAKNDKRPNVFLPKSKDGKKKIMKGVQTTARNAQSEFLSDIAIYEALTNDELSYTPTTNKKALEKADDFIASYKYDFDKLSDIYHSWLESEATPKPWQVAVGARLIQLTAENARTDLSHKLIVDHALMGHATGQALQAFNIIKKLTPSGQLYYLQGVINLLNKKYERQIQTGKMNKIVMPENAVDRALACDTRAELNTVMDKLKQEIAEQIPVTWGDRWNAWRYLAMLGNPRTHIRNLLGNLMFKPAVLIKDFIARRLEETASKYGKIEDSERTRVKGAKLGQNTEWMKRANEDYEVMYKVIVGEAGGNKYTDANEILSKRDLWGKEAWWGGKAISWLDELNSSALTAEDALFLKGYYTKAFAEYLQAQGVTEEQLRDSNFGASVEDRRLLTKARAHATIEAQRNTYRDANQFASWLNSMKRKGTIPYMLFEGLVPFTKTPANILARGIEYSPAGLISSVIRLSQDLKAGMTTAEALDRLAAGMTGTMVMGLGLFLSSLGVLKGKGPDDDKEKEFWKLQGHQQWSVELFGGSYTIDWMAPIALPLFVGSSVYDMLVAEKGEMDLEAYGKALAGLADPLSQLSMLDGVNSLISNLQNSDGAETFSVLLGSMLTSYLAQGVPTLLGQVARATDADRRATFIQKGSKNQALQKFVQTSLQAKIPGWEKGKMAYVDNWGRKDTAVTAGDWMWKVFETFFSPGYGNTINTTQVDEELQRLVDATGDDEILPTKLKKYFTSNGEEIDLTADQYEQILTENGQMAHSMLTELINTSYYASLTDAEKVQLIKDTEDLAEQFARQGIDPDYKLPSSWMDMAQQIGPVDYMLIKNDLQFNSTHEQLFTYLVTNPNLNSEQIATIIANEYSAPASIDSVANEGQKYVLTYEDEAAIQGIFHDLVNERLAALESNPDYINATPSEQGRMIENMYKEITAQTKETYAAYLDGTNRVMETGKASLLNSEAFNKVLDFTAEQIGADYGKGNINLTGRPNLDSVTIKVDDMYYVVPTTVVENGQTRNLTAEEAQQYFEQNHQFFGVFKSQSQADNYGKRLAYGNLDSEGYVDDIAAQSAWLGKKYRADSKIENPDHAGFDLVLTNDQKDDLDAMFQAEFDRRYREFVTSDDFNSAGSRENQNNKIAALYNQVADEVEKAYASELYTSGKATEELGTPKGDTRSDWDKNYDIAVANFTSPKEQAEWLANRFTGATTITNPDLIGHNIKLDSAQKAEEAQNEKDRFVETYVDMVTDPSWKSKPEDEKKALVFTLQKNVQSYEEGQYARYLIDNNKSFTDALDTQGTNAEFWTMLFTDNLTPQEQLDLLNQRYTRYVGTSYKNNTLDYVERNYRVDKYMEYIGNNIEPLVMKNLSPEQEVAAFEKLHKAAMDYAGKQTGSEYGLSKTTKDKDKEAKEDPNWGIGKHLTNPLDFTTPYTTVGTPAVHFTTNGAVTGNTGTTRTTPAVTPTTTPTTTTPKTSAKANNTTGFMKERDEFWKKLKK